MTGPTDVTPAVDGIALFDRLAATMNAAPERFELLGDVNVDLALVMRRSQPAGAFRLLLGFRGIRCETVAELADGEERSADCWLDGDLADWEAMFADIAAHGRAKGEWTLNTLTIFGERLQLHADDPMGWDKFHRFNQPLQEFFDGAAGELAAVPTDVGTEEVDHGGA